MNAKVAIIGCGPAGMISAICFARRGIPVTVFDSGASHRDTPTFNPERSYAIDITGHGLNAIKHIDAASFFDASMTKFRGIDIGDGKLDSWDEPGWIGSRGDIMRVLMDVTDARYRDLIDFVFDCDVKRIDVLSGTVHRDFATAEGPRKSVVETYDLIVAADGGSSVARQFAEAQVDDFLVARASIPYYTRMIAMDKSVSDLDTSLLYVMSKKHVCVAGAVNGPKGTTDPLWFCQIPFSSDKALGTPQDVIKFFKRKMPNVYKRVSEEELAAFAKRDAHSIGRTVKNSRAHAGKVIFVGDACTAYPPVGQGANAAMESAMFLDKSIGAVCGDRALAIEDIPAVALYYNDTWLVEAESMAWLATKFIMTRFSHVVRALVMNTFNLNVLADTKRSDLTYLSVYERAKVMGPIWSF